ncbi:hypothetical protein LCGC14_2860150, partial [marine sediment metagenome]
MIRLTKQEELDSYRDKLTADRDDGKALLTVCGGT